MILDANNNEISEEILKEAEYIPPGFVPNIKKPKGEDIEYPIKRKENINGVYKNGE